jgi:uncharacterized damage-inducible protein DinB
MRWSQSALFLMGVIMISTTGAEQAQAQRADALKKSFETVSGHLLSAAEMVPDTRYGERPVASVRTFLQLIGHVADGNRYYCMTAGGTSVPWDDPIERTSRTKAEAIAALRQSIQECRAMYDRVDAVLDPLIENIAHANLHYGNVITYLRVMGFTPPSS